MAQAIPDNCNSIAFDRTDAGEHAFVVASFWFRMTPAGASSRADGLGFALLNTAEYGESGPMEDLPSVALEEPDFRSSLGVGFDIHDNPDLPDRDTLSDNHVSIHYDGKVVAVFRIKRAQLDLAAPDPAPPGERWIHARIIVRSADANVRVILTPRTPLGVLQPPAFDGQVAVPGLVPYEARAYFGARTGGEFADHDIDSIRVVFTDEPPPSTFHDFDSPGTPFSLARHEANGPPAAVVASGGRGASMLRLAFAAPPAPPPPNCNSISFHRTSPGLHMLVTARFDIRLKPGASRADGIGFALLSTAAYGNRDLEPPVAPPSNVAEEPNFTGSVGVGFDIHRAAPSTPQDPTDNHVSIHFNGKLRAVYAIDKGRLNLASGHRIGVTVTVTHGPSTSTVQVRLVPRQRPGFPIVLPLTVVPGLRPYESRAYFAARSGGASADQDVDGIEVTWSGTPNPAVYGAWSPVMHWGSLDDPDLKPVVPVHLHLLPTGDVMFWDRHGDQDHPMFWDGAPRAWNPEKGFRLTAAPTGCDPPGEHCDVFCAGHTFLPNGHLLVAGGHIRDNEGLDTSWTYDPVGDSWTPRDRMNAGRWYPTTTTLSDGDVLVVSGDIQPQPPMVNDLPQVWNPSPPPLGLWRDLSDAKRILPLYPWMFQAPDGRVFYAGPGAETAFLDVTGTGQWGPPIPRAGAFRGEGSAVIWDGERILIMGGGGGPGDPLPPTNEADFIDIGTPAPAWTEMPPMSYRRRYLTPTLLPDGKVLVTGGSSERLISTAGSVLVPEMWDPAPPGKWSLLAGMQAPRLYHSTAILLPDARVLVGGGGHPESDDQGIDHTTAQIYSPPYLFKGPRPSITDVAAELSYGQPFFVATPQASDIQAVALLRLGSVTHTFNQNQRYNRLEDFVVVGGGLSVMAPADPRRSPPGHYMLFLLNSAGVPSVARIVSIH